MKNKTHHCEVCKLTCVAQADLTIHLKTPRHQQKAIHLEKDLATKRFKCLPCAFATDINCRLDRYLKSKRYLKVVAALSSSELDGEHYLQPGTSFWTFWTCILYAFFTVSNPCYG